jgi:putative glutamine amidotransferase
VTAAPLIGLLCGRTPAERYSTHRGYVASVTAAGGHPVLVPAGPDVDAGAVTAIVDHCHALVVTGGGDVDPQHYAVGDTTSAELLMDVDPERDITEIVAVQYALAQRKRVLGVCRGAQLLAVIGGGTLIADLKERGLEGHWDEIRQYEPVHPVSADPQSVIAGVLGSITEVNSIHHQAIADPGRHLRATAWSPDGVIEAVEGRHLLGVQWHPERLALSDSRFLAPFSWVMAA